MLRQELLYTTRDTSLPIRPAAVWAGTTEPVPTGRRSRCPATVDSNGQLSNLFSLGALTLTPPLPVTNSKKITRYLETTPHCNMEHQSLSCGTIVSVNGIFIWLIAVRPWCTLCIAHPFCAPPFHPGNLCHGSFHSLGCRRPEHTAKVRPVAGGIKPRLLAATHTQTYITSVRLRRLINTFMCLL
jgi:hypothetical protein